MTEAEEDKKSKELPQLASSWPAGQWWTPSHHWDSHTQLPSPHCTPWTQAEETGEADRDGEGKRDGRRDGR